MNARQILQRVRAAGGDVEIAGSGVLILSREKIPRQLVTELAAKTTAIADLVTAELRAEWDAHIAEIPPGAQGCRALTRFALESEHALHQAWHRHIVAAGIEPARVPSRGLLALMAVGMGRLVEAAAEARRAGLAGDELRLSKALDAWSAAADHERALVAKSLGVSRGAT